MCNACPFLTAVSKFAYLLSTSFEEGKCVLYRPEPIKDPPKPPAFLSQLHYVLQATSLWRAVYTTTKPVIFPAEYIAAHSLHSQLTEVIDSRRL